jgi:hypothetical protein
MSLQTLTIDESTHCIIEKEVHLCLYTFILHYVHRSSFNLKNTNNFLIPIITFQQLTKIYIKENHLNTKNVQAK